MECISFPGGTRLASFSRTKSMTSTLSRWMATEGLPIGTGVFSEVSSQPCTHLCCLVQDRMRASQDHKSAHQLHQVQMELTIIKMMYMNMMTSAMSMNEEMSMMPLQQFKTMSQPQNHLQQFPYYWGAYLEEDWNCRSAADAVTITEPAIT